MNNCYIHNVVYKTSKMAEKTPQKLHLFLSLKLFLCPFVINGIRRNHSWTLKTTVVQMLQQQLPDSPVANMALIAVNIKFTVTIFHQKWENAIRLISICSKTLATPWWIQARSQGNYLTLLMDLLFSFRHQDHPFSIPDYRLKPITAVIGRKAGYTLHRSPVHRRHQDHTPLHKRVQLLTIWNVKLSVQVKVCRHFTGAE